MYVYMCVSMDTWMHGYVHAYVTAWIDSLHGLTVASDHSSCDKSSVFVWAGGCNEVSHLPHVHCISAWGLSANTGAEGGPNNARRPAQPASGVRRPARCGHSSFRVFGGRRRERRSEGLQSRPPGSPRNGLSANGALAAWILEEVHQGEVAPSAYQVKADAAIAGHACVSGKQPGLEHPRGLARRQAQGFTPQFRRCRKCYQGTWDWFHAATIFRG